MTLNRAAAGEDGEEGDQDLTESKSDLDMLKNIEMRAKDSSPLGFKEATSDMQHTNRKLGASRDTKNKKETNLTEDAVLKIVNNIGNTAINADAMKLTQVGFIDILRKIN